MSIVCVCNSVCVFRLYCTCNCVYCCVQAILDHETYIMNLTEANLSDKPQWTKEYSAKASRHLQLANSNGDAIYQQFVVTK